MYYYILFLLIFVFIRYVIFLFYFFLSICIRYVILFLLTFACNEIIYIKTLKPSAHGTIAFIRTQGSQKGVKTIKKDERYSYKSTTLDNLRETMRPFTHQSTWSAQPDCSWSSTTIISFTSHRKRPSSKHPFGIRKETRFLPGLSVDRSASSRKSRKHIHYRPSHY